jgi:hypothetical protein
MNRRDFGRGALMLALGSMLPLYSPGVLAKEYLTVEEARELLFPGESMVEVTVFFPEEVRKAVRKATATRVRNPSPRTWRSETGGWFLVDQVIGKHENIDMAFALSSEGKVIGLEVLTYRESYGHEIMNPLWRDQFTGIGPGRILRLDRDIKNISGATLSCRHVTDAINRLTILWDMVLKNQ